MSILVVLAPTDDAVRSMLGVAPGGDGSAKDPEVREINERVLAALGLHWNSVGPMNADDAHAPALDPAFDAATALVSARSSLGATWTLHGRALSKTLPFWQRVLDRLGVAHEYRIDVSAPFAACREYSLRFGMTAEHAQLVWLEFCAQSLVLTEGRHRSLVCTDSAAEASRTRASPDYSPQVLPDVVKLHRAAVGLSRGAGDASSVALAADVLGTLVRFAPAFRNLTNLSIGMIKVMASESRARRKLAEARRSIGAIFASRIWRWTTPLRKLSAALPRDAKASTTPKTEAPSTEATVGYRDWLRDHASRTRREETEQVPVGTPAHRPLISVIVVFTGASRRQLSRALESLLAQTSPNWEAWICDRSGGSAGVAEAAGDPRIRTAAGSGADDLADCLNRALASCTGSHFALMDGSDVLSPAALRFMTEEILATPGAALVYSDDDCIDAAGHRSEACFKSGWNPSLLLASNYISRLALYRRDTVLAAGGFRAEAGDALEHDLALRIGETSAKGAIRHIPRVLYHFGTRPCPVTASTRHVVEGQLARRGAKAQVRESVHGVLQFSYAPPEPAPRVSILVPTTGDPAILKPCVDSVLTRSTYPDLELLVLVSEANRARADRAACLDAIAALPRVRLLVYPDQPFSYAWVNNWGERHATGELLCLLNDDVEVISADWLEQLVARVSLDGVAICGAMLYYQNDEIQHAGVLLGLNGVAAHQFIGLPRGSAGYFGRAAADQDLSAVTGGCMMVRRSAFRQLGGFNERLVIAYNDVDFCIRARRQGWRILWTPVAELYHHESVSVGAAASSNRLLQLNEERATMRRTWGTLLYRDPFYNPNLSLTKPYHVGRWARPVGR